MFNPIYLYFKLVAFLLARSRQGEFLWAKGVGDIRVHTANIRGDPETRILRFAIYVPYVQRDIISCNTLLKDKY